MDLPAYVKELLMLRESLARRQRARTQLWQPWLHKEDAAKQNATKQLPTTKWKRDRRTRPEYLRKSDPKFADNIPEPRPESPENSSSAAHQNGNSSRGCDVPLDMSVRQRGLPPSYSQAISDPSFRSSYRPPVTTANGSARDEIPTGISMCDPIIDEHFRRSLGKDYNTVFSNNNVATPAAKTTPTAAPPPPPSPPKIKQNDVIELMDGAGLSVDDHFAKALGDTWFKLNKKEADLKNGAGEGQHSVVTI